MASVAGPRELLSAFRRRAVARRQESRVGAFGVSLLPVLVCLALAGVTGIAGTTPASAQSFTYNPRPPRPTPPKVANDNQMLGAGSAAAAKWWARRARASAHP